MLRSCFYKKLSSIRSYYESMHTNLHRFRSNWDSWLKLIPYNVTQWNYGQIRSPSVHIRVWVSQNPDILVLASIDQWKASVPPIRAESVLMALTKGWPEPTEPDWSGAGGGKTAAEEEVEKKWAEKWREKRRGWSEQDRNPAHHHHHHGSEERLW